MRLFAERFAHDVSPLGPVAYFTAGESTDLPDVVLLHALGMNYTEWKRWRRCWLSTPVSSVWTCWAAVTVRSPVAPTACTRSRRRPGPSLRKLNLRQPVLLGHSYGGRVALELALREPRHFSGLMLLNSAGFIRYPALYESSGGWCSSPGSSVPCCWGRAAARPSHLCQRDAEQRALPVAGLGALGSAYAYRFAQHACPCCPTWCRMSRSAVGAEPAHLGAVG